MLVYLDKVLSFSAVRPGVGPDRVGLVAEVVVTHAVATSAAAGAAPASRHRVRAARQRSGADPARLFVTQSDAGVEVVVEGLPVELQLPNGLLMPLRTQQEEDAGPAATDEIQAVPLRRRGPTTRSQVFLSDLRESRIRVHLRIRFTEEREVVIEPAVPISVGACRFSGLPCRGVHDLGFLPYPVLVGRTPPTSWPWSGPGTRSRRVSAIEGTGSDHGPHPRSRPHARPAQAVPRRARQSVTGRPGPTADVADLEFVLEDLALPVSAWLTPVATHGRFGLRRAVLIGGDEVEAYDLDQAPMEVSLASFVDWRLRIFRLLFESPSTVVARMAAAPRRRRGEDDPAIVIDVTDGWLLQASLIPPHPLQSPKIVGARFAFMAVRIGVLLRDIQEAQGVEGWGNHLRAAGRPGDRRRRGQDETVTLSRCRPSHRARTSARTSSCATSAGTSGTWQLIPDLWFPEGLKFTAFKVVQLEVEELASSTRTTAAATSAFSGGMSIFPGAGDPEPKTAEPGTPGRTGRGSTERRRAPLPPTAPADRRQRAGAAAG